MFLSRGWHGAWLRLTAPSSRGAAPPAPPSSGGWPTPNRNARQILVVDVTTPDPTADSGSLRLRNLLHTLQTAGYTVVFIPDDFRTTGAGVDEIRRLGVEVPRIAGCRAAVRWAREHGPQLEAAILCRHHTAGPWLPLLRGAAPAATIVFDTVDLHYLREQREAAHAGGGWRIRAAIATRRRETGLVRQADSTWVVSPVERDLLVSTVSGARVEVLSNIIHAGTAGQPYDIRRDLLFVGGMRHPPNRDAARWLVEEIFPLIRDALPEVELHLVGPADPAFTLPPASGVHVHGHVPDLQPFLDGCRIALAPLRFGAGVKGKVNLSMAHGQPVVATRCAAEGMHLLDGHDVMVADEAKAFSEAVVRLYTDRALWERLAGNGRINVQTHFSPQAALAAVEATLGIAPAACND